MTQITIEQVRAFETKCIGVTSIVFAKSPAKAKFATLRQAMDAGYRVKFADISVRRAKTFDAGRYRNGDIASHECCHQPDLLLPAAPDVGVGS